MNPISQLLAARSIAIVGASRSPHKIGYQILKNLLQDGYKGSIFPVNPSAKKIQGLTVYPTLSQLPRPPELAIIVTPRELVPSIIDECSQVGCPAAIIITAGFAELDTTGSHLQSQLLKSSHKQVRILGPNCLGIISPVNHLNASFGPSLGRSGSIMVVSQSGAMITGILDWAHSNQLGLSHAISLGNRVDISELDCLQFGLDDPHTKQILIYLESFQNAREFFSQASKITPKKPIILLKGGISTTGQTASASHTAALATDQVLIRAFAAQTGVILGDNLHHWLNLAALFSRVKEIKGKDLCIVTNAGGPGVVASDEAEAKNLTLTPLDRTTSTLLTASFKHLDINNPLDLRGDAVPEDFATALHIVKKDPIEDTIMVIITPQTPTDPDTVARFIVQESKLSPKPIITILLGGEKLSTAQKILVKHNLPVYTYPSEALALIATKAEYDLKKSTLPSFPAAKKHHQKSSITPANLTIHTGFELLKSYGLNVAPYRIASTISTIPEATKLVGQPFYVKTASMHVPHKVLSGGVIGPLITNIEARNAFRKISLIYPEVLFQKSIHGLGEAFIGCKRDRSLGPFIVLGLGGSHTDILKDRHYTFIPADTASFKSSFSASHLVKLFDDHHLSRVDFIKVLHSLEQLMLDHHEIAELEINPIILTPKHFFIVDLKITLFEKSE